MESAITNKFYCSSQHCKSTLLFPEGNSHPEHAGSIAIIPEDLRSNFEFKSLLGKGSFGVVFEVYDLSDRKLKALKIIKGGDDFLDRDLEIIKDLHHTNIVQYFRSDKISQESIYILMELCDTDLEKLIKDQKITDNKMRIKIIREICKAIRYLHKNKHKEQIVHRDLKLSNILIKNEDVRVSDFGVSKPMKQADQETRIMGTQSYMPPELLNKEDDDELIASTKHDTWSIGIIVHQIFYEGKHPFQHKDDRVTKVDILKKEYTPNYEKIPKNSPIDLIIKGCLEKNPEKRFGIEVIMQLLKIKDHDLFSPLPQAMIQKLEEEQYLNIEEEQRIQLNDLRKQELEAKVTSIKESTGGSWVNLGGFSFGTEEKKTLEQLCEAIKVNTSTIERLYLDGNELGTGKLENARLLFDTLKTNENIQGLILDSNDLGLASLEIMKVLSEALIANKFIKVLFLNNNKLGSATEENMKLLCKAIKKNKSLQSIGLGQNDFGQSTLKNVELLCDALKNHETIEEVFMDNNELGSCSSDLMAKICEWIENNSHIRLLDLEFNKLGRAEIGILKMLYGSLKKRKNLKELRVFDCNSFEADSSNETAEMSELFQKLEEGV